ncbi:hypothetical protein YTPLAS18_06780 [Nitrospira sp.]|nr:hypothetical protein YTPLAS18_06780 [Nitrospira sp.]
MVWQGPATVTAQSSTPPSGQPAVIYWCPDRPADQQIQADPETGCAPLVDSSAKQTGRRGGKQPTLRPIPIEEIQAESTQFLSRYNDFLDCCVDDPAEIDRVRQLEAEAGNILQSIQASGIYNRGTVARQYSLGEMVRQVAQTRRDLRIIETRLERFEKGMYRLDGTDPEISAREARELEEDREGILRDFKPHRPPSSARTGVNIQDTDLPNWYGKSPTGDSTLRSTTGTALEGQSDLPVRAGDASQDTSLPEYVGPAGGHTTLPNSTGFGIGITENAGGSSSTPTRVGPDVGDSSLNR